MIFSDNKEISKQGLAALEALVKADSSYMNTPSYGLVAVNYYEETYDVWEQEHPDAAKNLKEWIYIEGQKPEGTQSIPVSQEIYNKIHANQS